MYCSRLRRFVEGVKVVDRELSRSQIHSLDSCPIQESSHGGSQDDVANPEAILVRACRGDSATTPLLWSRGTDRNALRCETIRRSLGQRVDSIFAGLHGPTPCLLNDVLHLGASLVISRGEA